MSVYLYKQNFPYTCMYVGVCVHFGTRKLQCNKQVYASRNCEKQLLFANVNVAIIDAYIMC